MFNIALLAFALVAAGVGLPPAAAPPTAVKFDDFFVDRTMRVDYFHGGDEKREFFSIDQIYDQGIWAGSRTRLLDDFDNGRYYVKVYDAASQALLFSRGFDTIFGEYRTTEPAAKGVLRTFHETALIPFPKKPIRFAIEARGEKNQLREVFGQQIDPASYFVRREALPKGVQVYTSLKSGDPHGKVDVVVVGEGYTAAEAKKYKRDLDRYVRHFFSVEPFASKKKSFNFYGVLKPSQDSGIDEPSHGSYKNTAVGASFDALDSERYVLTEDNRALRDIAAAAPYDAIYIMVNSARYGGGGIYNLYSTFTTDNQWSKYIFIHEFGHSFGGLADEYYSSATSYGEFYAKGVEPTEPNITALLDPKNLKWRALLTPGTAVPTPWEKADYDVMDKAYQKQRKELNERIAKAKRGGAAKAEVARLVAESEALSAANGKKVDAYMAKSAFKGQVGAFLGAGYSSEGLYRPMLDCIMFNRGEKPFCKVCAGALERAIARYEE
ncbi:MAG: peptidase M64 [Deltaproteobacteria bacterium]|nr:peptidase M64 [Deltaproteobacteria bacterium]